MIICACFIIRDTDGLTELQLGYHKILPMINSQPPPLLLNSIKQVDTAIIAAVVSPTKMSLISADGRYLLDTFKEVFFYYDQCWNRCVKGKEHRMCHQAIW